MSNVQRVIKYLAIAFAVFLTFSIVSGIVTGIGAIGSIFDDDDSITEKLNDLDISGDVNILDIDISASKLIIKEGDTFKAETNNKYISCEQEDNKLFIKEKKRNWFKRSSNSELIVYVPADFIFDGVAIETGAGKVEIDSLNAKKLYLDLGAGKAEVDYLVISDEAEIDGGAGEIIISDGNINDLDLDMGVGRLSLTSLLTGNSQIDAGVGEMNLNLVGTIDDYKIKIDKGIGSATIDGNSMNDDKYYGNGSNLIDIDGGIGSTKIKFID